ncbi:MAG: zinc-binding dehydrogenase [Chloroflexi bacterium]|nr:zinc-binding dehydrogenase [Chloroflexota bacterium]MCC6892255.1 zinc-binding dehydrogenase [Anaerolineae bacterium]
MLPKTYRKLIATTFSNNFRAASEIVEVELKPPTGHEITIRNHYAGVNATDVNISAGLYTPGATPPLDLGAELVGEVVAVGEKVTDYKVGDTVISTAIGGYAEYVTVRSRFVIPVPEATPQVLALVASGVTAALGLNTVGEMRTGETVLVTAAAGGTGQFAVQLAKLAGNTVIGTCGSDEKAERLTSLGCDRVINYKREDVGAVLKAEYPQGINLVYESVGGSLFDTCVENLAVRGRLVIIGYISEYMSQPELVTRPRIYRILLSKSASLRSMFLLHFIRQVPEELVKLIDLYQSGKLKAEVDPTPFQGVEQAADAVEYLHTGKSAGKVVVKFA